MEIIKNHFPHLSNQQINQYEMLYDLYKEWNSKINVISRKDIENLYLHHVIHSMSIGLAIQFKPGTRILDLGTGGGFPGIPLAILFSECSFRLIDGTAKKVMVASEIAKTIGLKNVECVQRRGEEEKDIFNFVVSRAVMPLPDLVKIIRKNISKNSFNAIENGLICLKGGNLSEELKRFKSIAETIPIKSLIDDSWFEDKYIIHIPL